MLRSSVFRAVAHCCRTLSLVVFDVVRLVFLVARSHSTLAAENLFLRKQLALFQERKAKPRRADSKRRALLLRRCIQVVSASRCKSASRFLGEIGRASCREKV